jgi:hypothetical protein
VVNLADIAAKTRVMPPSYLKGGNDVSEEFIKYAEPIVGPLPTVELLRTTH